MRSFTPLPFATSLALFATLSLPPVSAQSLDSSSLGDISSNCQSAALTLLGSDFATCSNLQGLLGIATGGTSGSLVDPVNSWLSGLCDRGNCSESAIQNATSVVDQGCSSDIQQGNVVITTLRSAIENFNSEKEAVCLRSTSNNSYCLTSLLSEVQNATGSQLSISSLSSLNLTEFEQIPASTVCTDCNSALLYKFSQSGSLNQSELTRAQEYCSDNQFGTTLPSTVSTAASNSSSNGGGNADSSSTGGTSGAEGLKALGSMVVAGFAGIVGLTLLA
ncbi:uncharacterized protein JCM6883_000566 [Sporobolomyces salmoneus]|uniref:uncharacterized protein n=1 Tax=Sporobolomyces salmoneus TaxID=183962 RepID=UPI003175C5E7